jgi:Rrf2 family protein
MLLSKSCIYGIQAAIYLAIQRDRKYVPIKEISEELDISFHFLTKILQVLKQAGFIRSEKGPKGGVNLSEKAELISVFDIVYAIDGKAVFENCIMGFPGCSDEYPCSLHKIWNVTKDELSTELHNATLSFIAEEIENGRIKLTESKKN